MKIFKFIKYLIEFIIIMAFFFIFKIIGLKNSIFLSEKIFKIFGQFFRSKKIITKNLNIAFPDKDIETNQNIIKNMWSFYGRIFAEYPFLKRFRENKEKNIEINGMNILEKIKKDKDPVIFISGHFDNFELMAMQIEKSGVKLSTIYRPLNNLFMNKIMEKLRKKYICKNQIKKGKLGLRESLRLFNNGYSMALMIDQRVSEGVKVKFFNKEAYTTSIPAQFVKKFNCKIVPINIERINCSNFKIYIFEPFEFNKDASIREITYQLNKWLEKIIIKNPTKWIWSHDRWK